MVSKKIKKALDYAISLLGIPYRWYVEGEDEFEECDKFWIGNSPPPSADKILKNDKSIVCTGLINLMRRYNGLSIPGLNGNITGKYKEFYKKYPGGTGAWFLYLYQKKRLHKLDLKSRYPNGTLLLARFKNNEDDQGHVAVVCDKNSDKLIGEQLIIHAGPCIPFKERNKEKNHGSVIIEPFHVSNNKWKKDKKLYYKFYCLPEDWLVLN
jgi:hypothetical protein